VCSPARRDVKNRRVARAANLESCTSSATKNTVARRRQYPTPLPVNVCGAVELNDELQGMAGRPGRDQAAHSSFPPSVHQAGPRPRNDRNRLAQDAELVHWLSDLCQDNECAVRRHGPRLRETSVSQLGAANARISLASDDGSPSTDCCDPLVPVLAYREGRQPVDQVAEIFGLWAAEHAALHDSQEKCRKCKRNASPPHALSLSSRWGDASDRNHTPGSVIRASTGLISANRKRAGAGIADGRPVHASVVERERGKAGRRRFLRARADRRRGRRRRAVLQEPVLGTADGERRNRAGVLGVLPEVSEASVRCAVDQPARWWWPLDPCLIRGGCYQVPTAAGAGITMKRGSREAHSYPRGSIRKEIHST